MRLYKIIKKPITTEKSSSLEMDNACYTMEVSKDATKIDIKKAIKELYGIEVANVRVLTTRAKFKYGKKRGMQYRKRESKKAYVTLKNPKDKLDFSIVK